MLGHRKLPVLWKVDLVCAYGEGREQPLDVVRDAARAMGVVGEFEDHWQAGSTSCPSRIPSVSTLLAFPSGRRFVHWLFHHRKD